jgi:hypothetical protein
MDGSAGEGTGVPAYSRPRGDNPASGTAIPRPPGSKPPTGGNGPIYVVPGYPGYGYGYCDPWSYVYNCGGGGYGGFYGGYFGSYGGFYDPWYGGGFSVSPQSSYSSSGDDGTLRLKIKPSKAEVYVDGYYVGLVDEFDGLFQKLHLESGAHRVEVRAAGYETLEFDVRISPEHTTTYQGEMKRIQ